VGPCQRIQIDGNQFAQTPALHRQRSDSFHAFAQTLWEGHRWSGTIRYWEAPRGALNANCVPTYALVTLMLGVDRELDRPPRIHTSALGRLDAHRDHVVGELACVLRGR
jgi:hypothetical protein